MEIVIAGRKVEWSEPRISYEDIVRQWVDFGDRSERVDYVHYLVIVGDSPSGGKFLILPSEVATVEEGMSFLVDVAYPV